MSKVFFIDTTRCTGCRGCQVACKQWHDLPAEATQNRGTFENPPDLSFSTYKLVRMREMETNGKLKWLFFPEQCRHCIDPPCLETAGDEEAIYQDEKTGAVIFTANTKNLFADEIIESCPYNIPRKAADGTLAKCDMCNDRVTNGLLPACVQTCHTGSMNFGDREQMTALAEQRLAQVRKKQKNASLVDADSVNVIYLIAEAPFDYHEFVTASAGAHGVTRHMALRKMVRPFTRALRQLA
ncbi:MAG: formate dehydrogenase [Desulfosarcina sp.]|nr:formate dehydrogenase [Desulfosarcina sp.]MBC2743134.1 formate dehydrogenase [Desulfosarcina sp.]MBC2766044.1 formate dehydrogenase [Desulfosarcina sp.]